MESNQLLDFCQFLLDYGSFVLELYTEYERILADEVKLRAHIHACNLSVAKSNIESCC